MAFFPVEQDMDEEIHDKLKTRSTTITSTIMDSSPTILLSGEVCSIGECAVSSTSYPQTINLNVTYTSGGTTTRYAKLGYISDSDLRTLFNNASVITDASVGTRYSIGVPLIYGAPTTSASTDRMPLSYGHYLIKTSSTEWTFVNAYFSSTTATTISLKAKCTMFFTTRVLGIIDL